MTDHLHPVDFLAAEMEDNPVARVLAGAIWDAAIEVDYAHSIERAFGRRSRALAALTALCEAAKTAGIFSADFATSVVDMRRYFRTMAEYQRPTPTPTEG